MGSRSMPPQLYTIGGVKVAFPCKAYPTQLSMMSMIIKGIDREQNCLLESPTGSGKSLALLCSCLAWQHNEYEKRERESAQEDINKDESDSGSKLSVVCVCNCAAKGISATNPQASTSTSPTLGVGTVTSSGNSAAVGTSGVQTTSGSGKEVASGSKEEKKTSTSTEEEDDFQPAKKRFRTPIPMPKKIKHRGILYEDETDDASSISPNAHTQAHWQMQLKNATTADVTSTCTCQCHAEKSKTLSNSPCDEKGKAPKRIPKIYFGTRTHKQIAQIIRELKKTEYKITRMTVLGSREYTCVHPRVSKGPNKNEGCKELKEGKFGESCPYYNGTHKIKSQWQLQDRGFTEAWDIEDLCKLGKKIRACPYYATRSLKDEADIVFCPYNYLVDPVIRSSMEINLKGQIVVLDEAHNIEDSARDAASYSVTEEQLQEAIDELDRLLNFNWRQPHTGRMRMVLNIPGPLSFQCIAVKHWITEHSGNLRQADYERALKVFSGYDIDGMLSKIGIIPATLTEFKHDLFIITEENKPDENEEDQLGLSLSSTAGMMLKGLFIVISFLFKDDKKYMRDYKIAVVRTIERRRRRRNERNGNRWLSARDSNEPSMNTTLHFWCLNPAVAFSDFNDDVRSIILTSGTLSPMTSFASELDVKFPITLEANHVIHKSQVWVGTIALGPKGTSLNASYRNAETFAFQDEIGRLLLHVCEVIPYGVLCFLPSYSMLSKLMDRWQTTGAWDMLRQKKEIMMESRGGDKTDFDDQLREYYQLIKDCEETDIETQQITGGLFFAVCRGKVSEGMDFADNNARAVITIGIPFPSFKDTQVELKRQYNDQHSASRGLLTGSEWYEIQAYRALNQALGRCIRHKMDWGALILVDDRYNRNPKKYISGLSKWVRAKVNHHIHSKDAVSSLSEFAQARLLKPCPEIKDTSMSSPPPTPSQMTTPSLNTAGFTPSQATTPSMKTDTSSGYTPIPGTPCRPQPLFSSSSAKLSDSNVTPNLANRSGTNSRRTSGSPPDLSAPEVTTQLSTHIPRPSTQQMVVANGSFVKATSVLPANTKPTGNLATPVVIQQGTTPVQPLTIPGQLLGSNLVYSTSDGQKIAASQSFLSPDGKNILVVPQVKTQQFVLVKTPTSISSPQVVQSVPQIVPPTAIQNVMSPNQSVLAGVTSEKVPAVSLKTSALHAQNVFSPQQGYGGSSKILVTSASDIPTPKAKLNFKDDGADKGKTARVQQSVAQKLQMFARNAALEQGKGQEDVSKLNADEKDKAKSCANVVDIACKQNGCQENKSAVMATNRKQQIERERMELNETPPPLFDSEATTSSESTVIPESPEKTNNDPNEVQRITHLDSEGGGNDLESRTRKRKLENVDVLHVEGNIDANAETKLDVKPGFMTETNNNKDLLKENISSESDLLKSGKEDMPSGRSRRRRLSRHKSEEKTSVIDGQEVTCKQEVKDEVFVNPDEHCSRDVSDGQVTVRRSARRRHGQDRGGRSSKTGDDFLDTIGAGASDKVGKCLPACRPGLFCLHCGEDLSADLLGLETISSDKLPGEFLKKVAKSNASKTSKRNRYTVSCKCQAIKGELSASKSSEGKETWLVGMKEHLRHCEPLVENTRVQKGMTLNAHWDDTDQCCYRLVICSSCPRGFIQLGYEVLATNNQSLSAGQVWFPPQCVGYCQQATFPKKMDI